MPTDEDVIVLNTKISTVHAVKSPVSSNDNNDNIKPHLYAHPIQKAAVRCASQNMRLKHTKTAARTASIKKITERIKKKQRDIRWQWILYVRFKYSKSVYTSWNHVIQLMAEQKSPSLHHEPSEPKGSNISASTAPSSGCAQIITEIVGVIWAVLQYTWWNYVSTVCVCSILKGFY